jgi:hypothetical protein
MKELPGCGTRGMYQRHVLNDEVCEECKRANSDYSWAHHILQGKRTSIVVPIDVAHELLDHGLADHLPVIVVNAIRRRMREKNV